MLTDAKGWFEARDSYMKAARNCRDTLIEARGHKPGDDRVKAAVGSWVKRARNAHAFALGRSPVIKKAVIIDSHGVSEGSIWARPVATNPATYAEGVL